jgi:hypothetical protein
MTSAAQTRGRRRGLYLRAASACIPLLLGMSACSAGASVMTSGPPKSATRAMSTTAPQHSTGVSSHLVFQSDTLTSGADEPGVLVIENNSGRPVVAPQSCLTTIEVQLTNAQHPLALHPTPPCLSAATLPVGITRLPLTLHASETVCLIPNGATASASFCQPLPAGTYKTQLFPDLNIPAPSPITVHVVADPR